MSDTNPPQQPQPTSGDAPYTPPAPPAAPPYASAPPSGYSAPAGGYQPAAYPAPAYGGAYGAYQQQKTNVLAIISMIASIVGIVFILPIIGSIAGVIMGHISLAQIKRTAEKGRGMALAGLIIGYAGLAFAVLGIILFASFIGWAVQQDSSYSSYSSGF
ncbi:DUF4190 domain-containing protein [Microbacterium radiodurans]|uniref:DUF4190 domain-containing protein n=1 Tax=Microbacterium radiodurans TaxID=661398 RepID=A0A5J5ITW6_9MICO|nr:DUF4190 domain-containing protein [Microbacterium radiodurans]KAA9087103.1 DUF4190 domain-containing protein [Microbacterium radiodurans]